MTDINKSLFIHKNNRHLTNYFDLVIYVVKKMCNEINFLLRGLTNLYLPWCHRHIQPSPLVF